jgi:hypothetical protein
LLEPLGARWRHTLRVADCARVVGRVLEHGDADVLVAAAYMHDVGYAPELAETGFHAVDGALFLRAYGHERLAGLVAYHSGAEAEAAERGLVGELAEFEDERSVVSRALTFCDLTTESDGHSVKPEERLAAIRRRYGPAAPEVRALDRSGPALMDDVRAVEALLADRGVRDLGLPANEVRSR